MNRIDNVGSAIIFTLLLVWSCTPAKERREETIALENIELSNLNGEKINLSDQQGKTVFINFWATWCRPCNQEMPSIAEEVERIQKFKESRSMTLNFVRLGNQEALGIQALPTTFIFNGEGNLIYSEVGFRKWDEPATIEMVSKLIKDHE